MIGGFDRHDGFAQRWMFVAKIGGKLLLGLRRADQQYLMGARQRFGNILEKMRIGGRSMTAMRALAAVNPLMLVLRMHHGFFLLGRREVPGGCLLMIDPNNCMIVWHCNLAESVFTYSTWLQRLRAPAHVGVCPTMPHILTINAGSSSVRFAIFSSGARPV